MKGRSRAFTLIEILLAVSIFAIVLAAINSVFFTALRLRNNATAAMERGQPLQAALPIIKRDLANLVPPGGTLARPLQTTTVTNLLPGQASPNFYCSTAVINDSVPWGDIQQVSYLLAEPTNRTTAGKDLFRAVTRNLLAAALDQPEQQWLMGGVQSINFLYFDGSQWLPQWDSTTQSNLPVAIKVQIQLAADNSSKAPVVSAPVELTVPLLVQSRTNQTQQTSGGGQ